MQDFCNGGEGYTLQPSTGQQYLVEVFLHSDTNTWSEESRVYLSQLRFRLPPAGGSVASDATAKATGDASIAGAVAHWESKEHDRVLVEGCCEPGSLLQKRTKYSKGCKVVPITKDDDFASDAGIRKCIESLTGPSDTLWFSAPCTGGSTWQFINLKRGDKTVAKIKLHWKLFRRLWAAFEVVAAHALRVGARVLVEWPRRCAYWKNDKVSAFLSKHGFVFADFDGCMYGLVATKGSNAGTPIQKPWRVACSPNSSLPSMLCRRCDRSHDHTPCAGPNTLLTQGYTEEIVAIVHQSIVRDIAALNKVSAKPLADGSVRRDSVVPYGGRAVISVGIEEMNENVALSALGAPSPAYPGLSAAGLSEYTCRPPLFSSVLSA